MKKLLLKLIADESGQDLIEYAFMLGFVAVAAVAIIPAISENILRMSTLTIRAICAALAAAFLGFIVLRRRLE